ncbi:Hypothetical protein GLP15_2933 [Giardia lamblia P15]|uniref:Uncharacterized protein n=1 Tax=Giardia intestinalis (strain P15) TaxID=658858 RepID=E1F912_GIAIA|nr:Hypothetical protein GLP15_2933 [Giardia lamblia P15]
MYTASFILTNISTEIGRIEGSLSDQILCFNRPALPCGSGYFYDLLRVDPNDIIDTQILIINPASQTYGTMYAKPLSFRLLFETRLLGTVTNSFLRIWLPVPPAGFTALGLCVSITEHPPDNFYCIRSEFTAQPQEDDINSFSFLILRSPVTANFSLIRSHYLSFSVNNYLPVLHPMFLLSLQKQAVIRDIPVISQLFDYILKPKSRRVDPAVDKHILLKLTLYKTISDADPKSTRSVATPKMGSSRSIRLSSASIAGGMNMSRFSRSGFTSRFVDDLPEIDDDLTTVYLVRPAQGPRFGDSIGTKNSVVPHDSILAMLSQEGCSNHAATNAAIITPELVHEIITPCIGFTLVAVMPSSFAPPEKSSSKGAPTDRESSVSYASESTTLNETYTLDDNRAAAYRASKESQPVKYTYLYAPIAPAGYTAVSVVLGDETGEPPNPASVLTVNNKYVTYTDACSIIGELYDRESAEYCYRFLKAQSKMLEERRKAATLCFADNRTDITTADKFTRPVLTDVPLPPPSYSSQLGLRVEATTLHNIPESPLRSNTQVAFSSDASTAVTARTGTACTECQDAVRSCTTNDSRLGSQSAALSDLSEVTDLDQFVQPTARAVQLVTPRGSPFILVNDPEANKLKSDKSASPRYPIILPALLNFVFSTISTSSKDFMSGVTIEQEYTKIATLDLPTHKLQFLEPSPRKPSYSCFGSIVYWDKQIVTTAQPLKPVTPQQPTTKASSNQRAGSAKNMQHVQESEPQVIASQTSKTVSMPSVLPLELGLVSKSSGFDSYIFSEPDALIPVWSSEDLETDTKIVVYEMIPQLGYAALGYVVSLGDEVPRKSRYCCVSLAFVSRATAFHVHNGIRFPQVANFDKQYLITLRHPHPFALLSNKDHTGMAYFNLARFNDNNARKAMEVLGFPPISSIVWIIKAQLLATMSSQHQSKISEQNKQNNVSTLAEAFGALSLSFELALELSRDGTGQIIVDERFDCGPPRTNRLASLLQEISELKKPGILLTIKSITTNTVNSVDNQVETATSTAMKMPKEKQALRGEVEGTSKLPRTVSGKRSDGLPPSSTSEPVPPREESLENASMKQCLATLIDPRWFTLGTRHVSTPLDLIPVVKNTLSSAVNIASNGSFARPAEVRYLATVQIGTTQCLVFRPIPFPNYVSLGEVVVPLQFLSMTHTLGDAFQVALTTGSTPKFSQEQSTSMRGRQESISSLEAILQKCLLCVHLSFCESVVLQTVRPAELDLAPVLLSAPVVHNSQMHTILSSMSYITDTSKQHNGQTVSSIKTSVCPSDSAKTSTLNLTVLGDVPTTRQRDLIQFCPHGAPFIGLSQENMENVRSNSGRFTPSRSKSRGSTKVHQRLDFLELYDDIDLPETENLAVASPRPSTRGNNALILQQAQDLRSCFDIGHVEQYSLQQSDVRLDPSSDLYADFIGYESLPGHPVSTGVLTLLADGYREDGGNGCWVYSDGVHLFASLSPQKELSIPRLKASYLNQLIRKLLLSKEEELHSLKSKENDQAVKDQTERGELASLKSESKTFSTTKRYGSEQVPLCQPDCFIDTPYDEIYYWMDPIPAYSLLCTCLAAGGKPSKEVGLELEVRTFDEGVQKDLVSACMVSLSSLHMVSYEQPLNSKKLLSVCPPIQLQDGTRKGKQSDVKKSARSSEPVIHKNVVINTPASRLNDIPDPMKPSVDVESLATKYNSSIQLLRTLFGICDVLHAAEQFKVMGRDTILSFRTPQGYVLVSDKVPVVRTNEAAKPAFLGIGEGDVTPGWFLIFEKVLARCAGSYITLYNMTPVELVLLVFQLIGFVPGKAGSSRHGIKIYYTPTEASLVNFSPESVELLLEQKTI